MNNAQELYGIKVHSAITDDDFYFTSTNKVKLLDKQSDIIDFCLTNSQDKYDGVLSRLRDNGIEFHTCIFDDPPKCTIVLELTEPF